MIDHQISDTRIIAHCSRNLTETAAQEAIMQARNQCAREIFSSRGGLDAVASVLEWGSLADGGGQRRTPRDARTAVVSTLTGQHAAVVLRDAP